ncbi:hypothetical protein DFS34DRAFT_183508 [Phlyctochytrium arcticum]|nr:hypothetical protein DFS34DRAFT_183508 [Phlyctochytrium arcticum]
MGLVLDSTTIQLLIRRMSLLGTNLRSLTLRGGWEIESDLANFLGLCPPLRYLSLEDCELGSRVCDAIARRHGKTLNVLRLGLNPLTLHESQTLCRTLDSCKAIKRLYWTSPSFDPSHIPNYQTNFDPPPDLTKLHLNGVSLSADFWKKLCAAAPKLTELNIADTNIDDASLLNVLITLGSTLRELDLSNCHLLTYHSLRCIAQYTPNLRSLRFTTPTCDVSPITTHPPNACPPVPVQC